MEMNSLHEKQNVVFKWKDIYWLAESPVVLFNSLSLFFLQTNLSPTIRYLCFCLILFMACFLDFLAMCFQPRLHTSGGIFWWPRAVADIKPRLLVDGGLIAPDRQEKTIIMNRFLSWEGISEKWLKERLLLFLHLTS